MSDLGSWLELYALLLTLLVLIMVLAEPMKAAGQNSAWVYSKLILVIGIPAILIYGIFQPLPPNLSLVLKVQALVLTSLLIMFLVGEFLAAIWHNRIVIYSLLVVVALFIWLKLLPLL